MDLVVGAIGTIGPKLLELLEEEYKLHKDLGKEVKSLSDELESIHAALCKVAEIPWDKHDEQVKVWARQVREASYDMEDILDTFLVRVEDHGPAKKGRLKRALKKMSSLFSKGKARHDIVGAIEDIKKQLQEMADRRSRYKIDEIVSKPAATSTIDPRLKDMHNEATQLIGIDKSSSEVESKMLSKDGNQSNWKTKIVSVVGVGGLGKTTLAKAVYDKLNSHFDFGAFVPVGRNPDLKKVFRDILIDLDKERYMEVKYNILDERQLINELRDFLKSKRYFIVLDDVWDITSWKIIKSALDLKNSGSRVIVTTRNRDIASEEEVYELEPLSSHDSKRLFYIRLFGGEGKCPANHPAEASEKILKKCGGVPLAIITMASLLVGKSREDWFGVCNTPGFYRGKGSQQADDTEWILSLSYYDMPSYLRTCLLYLSVYPEDYEIEKDSLIWKWIAEGFVEKKSGTSLFQQGEEYFNQLINRSMIQAVESNICRGLVCGCRVHDMVLDLIRDLSCKENFVTISSNDDEKTSPYQNKVRRLAIQFRMMKETQLDDHMGLAQVRSLVACRSNIIESWVLHQGFELLRVLDLERCHIFWYGHQGLKHLGNLLHLRYLGLRHILANAELPEEIGKLKFLQIIDLERSNLRVLPSGTCKLTQLVCLRAQHLIVQNGSFLRKATSLEELRISIDNLDEESQRQFMKDLGNLSELRVLCIFTGRSLTTGMVQLSDLMQPLGNLHKLQHLLLAEDTGYRKTAMREWDGVALPQHLGHLDLGRILFHRLPSWISHMHLPSIRYLSLGVDHMDEEGLRALGGLRELVFLALVTRRPSMACTATVADITAGDGFFTKLRNCRLYGWNVQLVVNEDSTGVSFSICNGMGAMAIGGSRTMDEGLLWIILSRSLAPPPVMPNLQELFMFDVPVRALYNLDLECFPSLRRVEVGDVDYEGASADHVEKAEADLRIAALLHPNRPAIAIERPRQQSMMVQSANSDDKGVQVVLLDEDS